MKSSRNLVERINIPDDLNSRSMRSQESKSININNSRVIQNVQSPSGKNQTKEFQKIIERNIPISGRKKSQPSEYKLNQTLEEQKIHELNNNFSSLSVSVSNIKNEYSQLKQSQSKILSTIKKKSKKIGKLDDPKITEYLFKKQQQQQLREKRRLDQIARLQKKKGENQQKQRQLKQQTRLQKMSQIKKYSFISEKNNKSKLEESQKQKNAQEIFKKYRNSVPLFQIKQKQNLQNQIKRVQMVKQFLKKHKDQNAALNKPIHQKHVEQHRKWYEEEILKLEKEKNQSRIQTFNRIQNQNQKLKDLYRGKATQNFLNEIKDIQDKRVLPYRIRSKMKDYEEFVKQNHKPQPSKSKLKEMRGNSSSLELKSRRQTNSTLSFRQIKRYKYLHGVSFGQIIEERPMAKSYQQQKRTGNGYLEFMKSLPKKRTEPDLMNSMLVQIPVAKPHRSNPLLHNRKKRPFIHLNSEPTRNQINMVLQQLRINDGKIKERQRLALQKGLLKEETSMQRSQITQDILLNLQTKLNLLHKLEDNDIKLEQTQ